MRRSWGKIARLISVTGMAIGALGGAAEAFGRISQTTEIRDYRVYGTTPRELVSYMRARPFAGDNGPALANIRPRYSLKIETGMHRGQCRIRSVHLSIRFVMSLPRAMDRRRFKRGTAGAWRSFRAFTLRHESVHRRYYLTCARRFLQKARRLTASGCFGMQWKAQSLLDREDRACNRLHDAFDRRDFPRVARMALFRRAYGSSVRQVARRGGSRYGRRVAIRRRGFSRRRGRATGRFRRTLVRSVNWTR